MGGCNTRIDQHWEDTLVGREFFSVVKRMLEFSYLQKSEENYTRLPLFPIPFAKLGGVAPLCPKALSFVVKFE